MYIDAFNQFSDSQAVAGPTSDVGTNVIDLSVDRSIGNGEPLAAVFVIDVAADQGTGDESYTFEIEYSSDAAQTTARQLMGRRIFEAGTPTAPAQDADLLVAGFKVIIPLPPTKLSESERFIGIRYVTAGTTPSITVTAMLMPMNMIDATNDYVDGFNIT